MCSRTWFRSALPRVHNAMDPRKLSEIRSMGFDDDVMIERALARASGNVESAVEMMFEGVIPGADEPAPDGIAAGYPPPGPPPALVRPVPHPCAQPTAFGSCAIGWQ